MDKLKVGIIGCGVIFDLNILGYLDREDIEITCLCDSKKRHIREKIEKFNLGSNVKPYDDYKEMLDVESIDILEILLPHFLHSEVTQYAAQKDILGISVQKPMANTIIDCEKMIEACKKNNVKLKVFENFMFYPPIMKAKQLLDEGIIGEVNSIHIKTVEATKGGWDITTTTWLWRLDPNLCGGGLECGSPIVFDDGFHKFWLAQHLVGAKIEKVYSWIDRFNNLDVPAYIMWKYAPPKDSDFLVPTYGSMEYNYSPHMTLPSPYYSEDDFISITGSEGVMWINQATAGNNIMSKSAAFPAIVVFKNGKIETISDMERDWKYGFINSTHHFIEAVKNDTTPILSGEEGKYTTQFALAALKSSIEGKEICPYDIKG
ncbi:MAG: Gfo/Idh/MocA family protein [Candidatus Thorarchaeota archaeon]